MVSTIILAENHDSEALDSIFLNGHLMSRNLVTKDVHCQGSKMLFARYA